MPRPASAPRLGRALAASILEGLTKVRHPAAKAAAKAAKQGHAKQEVSKKRSCSSCKPACASAKGEESASLGKSASTLASLQNAPTKKNRPPGEPLALSLAVHLRGRA